MRKKIITALLLAISIAAFSAEESRTKEKIMENLKEIQDSYSQYLDRQERREVKRLMRETMKMIEEELEEKKPEEISMNDEAYKTLYNEVKSRISDRDKNEIIYGAVIKSKISCKQLKELFQLYTFDSYIEEGIYKIYDSVSDKENFIIVISVIKSDFTKDRVNEFIAEKK